MIHLKYYFKNESIKSIPLLIDASKKLKELGDLLYYSKAMLSLQWFKESLNMKMKPWVQ